MNFDDINKIYKSMEADVYPYVKSIWKNTSTETVLIDRYLQSINAKPEYKLIAVPYLFNPKLFYKEYYNNCIIFYNTPNPEDGLLLTIHQISPTLHVHSRYCCWVENLETHSYVSSLLFHKNDEEAVTFIRNNFQYAMCGNTEERKSAGLAQIAEINRRGF